MTVERKTEAYFEDIERQTSLCMLSAKERIYVAVAWFTNHVLYNDLINALKRNVDVRVLIVNDLLNRNEFGLDFGTLVKYGAEVRMAECSAKTMHHKFCVIDNTVITGSYNWTYHANKNHENIVVIEEQEIADKYCAQFETLCRNGMEVSLPYEHLKWTDVKEGEFTELRRSIYQDVVAKNDVNREIRKSKLIKLNDAFKSGSIECLAKAESAPICGNITTLMDVLIRNPRGYELKLWKENRLGYAIDNVDGHIKLDKWIFLPCQFKTDGNSREYISGILQTYGSRGNRWAKGLNFSIYDTSYIALLKKFIGNKKMSYYIYKDIPEELLCIEYAKLFFFKFPSPWFNKSLPRTVGISSSRLVSGIDVLGIAKDANEDNIVFYDGWNPQERGLRIQNEFFTKC